MTLPTAPAAPVPAEGGPTPASAAAPAPSRTGQAKVLLLVVIALGGLLLVGFGAVIGRIIYLAVQPAREAAVAPGSARLATLPLPAGAQLRHTALDGSRLAVTWESPGKAGIVVLDLASGQVVGRIELVTDLPRQ